MEAMQCFPEDNSIEGVKCSKQSVLACSQVTYSLESFFLIAPIEFLNLDTTHKFILQLCSQKKVS